MSTYRHLYPDATTIYVQLALISPFTLIIFISKHGAYHVVQAPRKRAGYLYEI